MGLETDTDLPGEILHFSSQTRLIQDVEIMTSRLQPVHLVTRIAGAG